MKPKQQKEYENCDLCKKSEKHSHCTECGKLLSPINKCKCPERQGGNWIPKQQKENVSPIIKKLAIFMHNEYEDYARKVGWKTQKKCQTLFDELPPANKEVMLWVARSIYDKFILEAEKQIREDIIKKIEKLKIIKWATQRELKDHIIKLIKQ